ncbi:MAG TPA: hypothetical protein VJX74_17020 [Blastocatellia bacterium]|nr:hypothetical protein [Blastocatellia bacterium]
MKRAKNKTSRALVISVVAVLSLLLLPQANIAHGQTAQAKETFAAFWTRFKAALAKDDRQAIAAMTKHCKCGQMPFDNDKEFLDEWYPALRRNRACLARSKPIARGKQNSVICRTDGDEVLFERIGSEWKLINVNPAP